MVCNGFKMWGWEGLGQEASSGKRAVSSGEAVATWTVAGLSFWLKTTANAASIRWWRQPFPGMGIKTQNSNPTSLAKQKGPIFCVCVCVFFFFFFCHLWKLGNVWQTRLCHHGDVNLWVIPGAGQPRPRGCRTPWANFRHQEGPHLLLSLRSSGLAFPVVGEEGHGWAVWTFPLMRIKPFTP